MAINDNEYGAIKFAEIDTAADATIVAAQAGKKIRVLGYAVVAAGSAETVEFLSDSTSLTGAMSFAANGGISYAGGADAPAFETNAGEALKVNLGSTNAIDGHLTYVLVDG